ncbi:MAG: XdhC family protein [Oscillospiraceae bacterium]|nr:XdhC family protein [Oscillospiraceae bacterium]
MESLMNVVKKRILAGEPVEICQILESDGSSPRGAGAKMAVFQGGSISGTVGGGSVELETIRLSQELLKTGGSLLRRFYLYPNRVSDLGMICGGEVLILLQFLPANSPAALEFLTYLCESEQRCCNAWLILLLRDGALCDYGVFHDEDGFRFLKTCDEAKLCPLLQTVPVLQQGMISVYTEPICRRGALYLFGGGHVGQALVPVLAPLGFRVVVLEDRPALSVRERFPLAHDVLLCDFSNLSKVVTVTKDDYCVVMTPGHQSDRLVLSQVLRTEAPYIGCIGSRKKIAKTNELLQAEGFSQADCDRVHSPIGLPIGAVTPEEIAISVAAELIAFRAGKIS